MSGAKRRTKYRKGVENQILDDLPEPQGDNQVVCRVHGLRGGNIIEVETAAQYHNRTHGLPHEIELCRLPSRFRNVIWVKRGSFLICEQVPLESDFEGKVRFVCEHVLFTPDSIKHLKQRGLFPKEFCEEEQPQQQQQNQAMEEQEEEEEEDFAPRNPNRRQVVKASESSSSDEDEE